MKLPTLLKTPKYQRFNIEPRYYDPVREEIDQRTNQIRIELELEKKDGIARTGTSTSSRLKGAFMKKRAKAKGVNLMQGVILLLLVGGLVGFWYFGNIALYGFAMISSLLLYLKIRGKI